MGRRAVAIALGLLLLGCGATRSRHVSAPLARPAIDSVTPPSGPAGADYPLKVQIFGRNFADSGNVVTLGSATAAKAVSSHYRTRIEIYLPKEAPASGEVPPMVFPPGKYPITVMTSEGTSNAVQFVLTRPPAE